MTMSQDVRFAVRLLTKQRGFTFAATLALALGIGMNATVFTLVNSFLFGSLPYQDSDRLRASANATRRPGDRSRCVVAGLSGLARRADQLRRPRRLVGRHDDQSAATRGRRALQRCVSSPRTPSGCLVNGRSPAAIFWPTTTGLGPIRWSCSANGSGRAATPPTVDRRPSDPHQR